MKTLCIALILAACHPTATTTGRLDIPTDSTTTCRSQCKSLGLELGSVVIMASNVGCVCNATPSATPGGGGAAGGMAAILLQQQVAAGAVRRPTAPR